MNKRFLFKVKETLVKRQKKTGARNRTGTTQCGKVEGTLEDHNFKTKKKLNDQVCGCEVGHEILTNFGNSSDITTLEHNKDTTARPTAIFLRKFVKNTRNANTYPVYHCGVLT